MTFFRMLLAVALGFALSGCGANGSTAKVGEVRDLAGLRFYVTKVVVGGDADGPWFQVWMRMKNISDHEVRIPDAAIRCGGTDVLGTFAPKHDRSYSLTPGARIFVHSSAAGVMWLEAPGVPCKTPAFVQVKSESKSLRVRIPDRTVRGLNTY